MESSIKTLAARQEIDALYTPLDEAVVELQRRRQDSELCARVEEFHRMLPPTFIPPKPFAGLFRYLATPNFEFELFLKIASQAELHPLYIEYQQDDFVAWNRDKYRLCRPGFAVHRNQVRNLRLVNFEKMRGKSPCRLSELTTGNGMSLACYYKTLLARAFSDHQFSAIDFSCWVSHERTAKYFYLRRMALFICNGILFENFVAADESELRFAREKVIPSFVEAVRLFGVRPLIVPLLPLESEGSDHWRCLSGSLYPYAVELLRTKP